MELDDARTSSEVHQFYSMLSQHNEKYIAISSRCNSLVHRSGALALGLVIGLAQNTVHTCPLSEFDQGWQCIGQQTLRNLKMAHLSEDGHGLAATFLPQTTVSLLVMVSSVSAFLVRAQYL